MTDTTYVEVPCPVTLTDSGDHHGIEAKSCEGAVLVEMAWEAPESNWGADADGNRGMYIAGYWYLAVIPDKCDTCGFTFSKEGKDKIEAAAMDAGQNIEGPMVEDYGGDDLEEPDYDDD